MQTMQEKMHGCMLRPGTVTALSLSLSPPSAGSCRTEADLIWVLMFLRGDKAAGIIGHHIGPLGSILWWSFARTKTPSDSLACPQFLFNKHSQKNQDVLMRYPSSQHWLSLYYLAGISCCMIIIIIIIIIINNKCD